MVKKAATRKVPLWRMLPLQLLRSASVLPPSYRRGFGLDEVFRLYAAANACLLQWRRARPKTKMKSLRVMGGLGLLLFTVWWI